MGDSSAKTYALIGATGSTVLLANSIGKDVSLSGPPIGSVKKKKLVRKMFIYSLEIFGINNAEIVKNTKRITHPQSSCYQEAVVALIDTK